MADKQRTNLAKQSEQTKSLTSVEALMGEWFRLKDEQKAIGRERSKFHETYECQNMQSNGYMEQPIQCIYREYGNITDLMADDACQPCKDRHHFYVRRKQNAHKRSAILNRVRKLVQGNDLRLDDPEATITATNTSPSKPHHHKEG